MEVIKKLLTIRKEVKDTKFKKITNICLRNYILKCFLLRNNSFSITFKGKYMYSRTKWITKLIKYYTKKVVYFINIKLKPNTLCFPPLYPHNFRLSDETNECALEYILEHTNLKIKDEKLYPTKSVYIISKA